MNPLGMVEKYPETIIIFQEYDDVFGKCLLCNYLFYLIESIAAKQKIGCP